MTAKILIVDDSESTIMAFENVIPSLDVAIDSIQRVPPLLVVFKFTLQ